MTSNPIENAHHYLSKNINGVLHNINLNSNSFDIQLHNNQYLRISCDKKTLYDYNWSGWNVERIINNCGDNGIANTKSIIGLKNAVIAMGAQEK